MNKKVKIGGVGISPAIEKLNQFNAFTICNIHKKPYNRYLFIAKKV